jgi:hypothetical protein
VNYYFDENLKTFKKCDTTCNKCSGSSKNCIDCITNHYKIDGTNSCKTIEEAKIYYKDSNSNTLKLCDSTTCSGCTNNATDCKTCAKNYYKIDGGNICKND